MVLVLNLDGSLDDFVFIVIDLGTSKNLTGTYVKYWGDADFVYWNNDTDVLVNQKNDQGKEDLVSYSFATQRMQKKIKMKNQTISMVMNNSWVILADPKEDNIFYSRDFSFNYTIPKDYNVVAENESVFYLSHITKLTDREFTTYYTLNKGEKTITEIAKIEGNVTTQFLLDKFLAVLTVNGTQFQLNGLNLEKKVIKKIAIPDFVAVTVVSQKEAFKGTALFQVSLVSDINKDYTLDWDFSKNQFIDLPSLTEFKERVLVSNKLALNVEYKYIRSFDGTLIPIRLVYKSGTPLKDRQVYMETYGGFLIDGYAAPMQDHMRLEFLKRGGVYIGTAVRGGNEYGQRWHDQAVKENKIKVVEDLASIAKWIVESKLATKENVVSAGSSNGGFVVTLAGLLYPQYFGMVIAHNAVLDLLVKEKLDYRNENGWVDEFGDSTKPNEREYVVKMSPLENAEKLKNGPRFFLINAQNDSRVNPAHSIKFARAASDLGPNVDVEFYSTVHSGHFNLDPNYNDVFGANALSVKWATIFDYFALDYFL